MQPNINEFLGNDDDEPPSAATTSVLSYVSGRGELNAEILWTLNVIEKHYSFRSCSNSADIIKQMFPDSDIAGRFSCGERKCAYLSTFGLAPYFLSLMTSKVKSEKDYVLLFDESTLL